jgi:AcrR family transcriptional regulator
MSTKTSTRQRLVDAAVRRFYRDGFRSVGIDQILSDVGISKTAFYKHFESKEDLMLAALEMQNDWLQSTFRTMIAERGGPAPIGQLHAAFDVVERIIESDEFQGCIFVNAAMEFPLLHEPAHVLASQSKRAIEDLLYELAVEAQSASPRKMSQQLCLVMEGAYVTRQVTGDKSTINVARELAKLIIAAHCPGTNDEDCQRSTVPRESEIARLRSI